MPRSRCKISEKGKLGHSFLRGGFSLDQEKRNRAPSSFISAVNLGRDE